MTHDPFQTYAMLGGYSGVPTLQPFTQQTYGQFPVGLNPFAQQQPYAQQQPGISPFQGGQQNPFAGFQQANPYLGFQQHPLAALQNPLLAAIQNPLIAAALQNPMLQNPMLQNPMLHPLLAQTIAAQQQQYPQTGLGGSPFGQTGYPLAPQSWIGQGQGQGAQTGQIHPLYQQLAARAFTPGINPWAGY